MRPRYSTVFQYRTYLHNFTTFWLTKVKILLQKEKCWCIENMETYPEDVSQLRVSCLICLGKRPQWQQCYCRQEKSHLLSTCGLLLQGQGVCFLVAPHHDNGSSCRRRKGDTKCILTQLVIYWCLQKIFFFCVAIYSTVSNIADFSVPSTFFQQAGNLACSDIPEKSRNSCGYQHPDAALFRST